jgi:uncharacterized membrane protein YhhN
MNFPKLLNTFLVFSVIYLIGLLVASENFNFTTKPILIPWLIMAVYAFPTTRNKLVLMAALAFSWLGDIVLLFAYKGQLYFIIGLISFLIAHVAYILAFKKEIYGYHPKKSFPWIPFVAVVAYLIALWYLLIPVLGGLKIPVVVYSLVISGMLAMSIYVDYIVASKSSKWMMLGAVCFVMSDSILAINKFLTPVPLAALAIMSTYLFAQYALVRGFLSLWGGNQTVRNL